MPGVDDVDQLFSDTVITKTAFGSFPHVDAVTHLQPNITRSPVSPPLVDTPMGLWRVRL